MIRVILEEKKRMRGHYYLTGSPVQGRASEARRSPNEVELQVEVDQALDGRLGRTRGDIVE